MPTLRLRFLGKLNIHYGTDPLPKPATLKSQSLLAYLALHRRQPQPRDSLAAVFWGDRPERKARHSLSTALWHIRRCLPNETFILSDPQTVQFNPHQPLWLDAAEFTALAARADVASLQKAEALYRGDFLDGFSDDWVINERYRLETTFLDLLARLMAAYEAEGDVQAALAAALRLLALDPLREDAHRLSMRAYCRLGQRNAALEQYHRCRQSVREELDVEPMVETQEIYQAILENRLVIAPTAVPHQPPQPPAPPSPAAGHSPFDVAAPSRLVGRQPELAFLDKVWQEVQAGEGTLVLVNGEAGIGKTRLVETFAARLRWQGSRVLWGRCYEFERLLPYQPVAEALSALLLSLTSEELADLPAWALGEAARLVPELLEKHSGLEVAPSIRSDQERARLFEGLTRLIATLSAHNALLIVLEDLHWATGSTLQLLHYLARHLQGRPVLLVGTSRLEALQPPHPLGELQQQLQREGLARPLPLARLSPEDVAALLMEMSGAGETVMPLAERLYRETEGNPFFMMEILKSLFETGAIYLEDDAWRGDFARISQETLHLPGELSQAITKRIHRLSDEAQEALYLAAVLGREFDFDLLNAAWGRGAETTLEALDELLRLRLISEGAGARERDYTFTHHKIQEVAYAAMPRIRRQQAHAKVGASMARLYGFQAGALAGELAFHFQQSRQPAQALDWLEKAGEQARKHYAVEEAAAYFTQALSLGQEMQPDLARESDLLRRRAETHLLGGAFDAARRDLEQALALARKTADTTHQVQVLLALADCHFHQDDFAATVQAARQAAALAQDVGDERSAGVALRFEGQGLYFLAGRAQEGRERLEQACARLEAAGDDVELGWAQLHLGALFQEELGELDAALPHLQTARRLFAATGCVHGEILISDLLGNGHLYRQDLQSAIEYYGRSLSAARQIGYAAQEAGELARLAIGHTLIGDLTTARQYAAEGLQLSRKQGTRFWEAYALYWLGQIAYEESKPQEALHLTSESLRLLEELNYQAAFAWLKAQLSLIYRDLGGEANYIKALELAQQAYTAVCEIGSLRGRIRPLSSLAMAHLALGNQTQALAYSRQAMELAEKNPLRMFQQEILFNRFQILRANGQATESRQTLRQAHDLLTSTAKKIQDPQLRNAFLKNVRVNRAITTEFAAEQPF